MTAYENILRKINVMEFILPFKQNAPIDVYNYNLAELGVLLTIPEAIKEVYNENINIFTRRVGNQIETGFINICPLVSYFSTPIVKMNFGLNKNAGLTHKEMFIYFKNMMVSAISNNCYVSGVWDEFYINDRSAYNKYHFVHDWFCYGCNDDCLYIFGYTNTGKPGISKIPYRVLFDSIYNENVTQDHLCFYRLNTRYPFGISLSIIDKHINNYINSSFDYSEPDCTIGISVHKEVFDYTVENKHFDMTSMRLLLNHKKLLLDRYRFIHTKPDDSILKALEKNYELMQLSFMSAIKYNITLEKQKLESIEDYLKTIVQTEYSILPDYMNGLTY